MEDNPLEDWVFEQVKVRNYQAQAVSQRYPSSTSASPPVKTWRLNLVALSSRYNLYFLASQGNLLVFTPQDTRNTISGDPNITLQLPVSKEASSVRHSIDPAQPHCVNNLKTGILGNLEVIVMVFDDGDVIAFYTHTIDHAVHQVKDKHIPPPLKPFLHENVHSSAWGLAIHTNSRLIAVGSNLHEITIFALGCHDSPDDKDHNEMIRFRNGTRSILHYGPRALENAALARLLLTPVYGPAWVLQDDLEPSLSNIRIQIKLPPTGSNIPSLDFTSDEKGKASTILAADIRGNLWQYNLSTLKFTVLPTMVNEIEGDDMLNIMGWGVVAIPKTMFIDTQTPGEALGTLKIMLAWKANCELDPFGSCFDVTPRDNRDVLQPPSLSEHHPQTGSEPCLSLETEVDDATKAVSLAYEALKHNCHPLKQPTDRLLVKEMKDFIDKKLGAYISQGGSFPTRAALTEFMYRLRVNVQHIYHDYKVFISYLRLYLDLAPSKRNDNENADFKLTLNVMAAKLQDTSFETYFDSPSVEFPSALNSIKEGWLTKEEAEPISADECAVLMCHRYDIHLLPPWPKAMPQTICKGSLVPKDDFPQPVNFMDRLSLQALIPPLGLVVVGTPAGRVVLLCPTRMPRGLSDLTEVITMRVELILPLGTERGDSPLVGLAASPVWDGGGEMKRRCVRPPAWRLLLHYMDHTILSYELSRGSGEELVVV